MTISTALTSILVVTALYALEALAFVIILRATGVLNFAQGQMMALGAYLMLDLGRRLPDTSFSIQLVLALLIAGGIGALIYRIVIVRLEGSAIWAAVITLFGVGLILDGGLQLVYSPVVQSLPSPFSLAPVHLPFDLIISQTDLVVVGLAAIFVAALFIVMFMTPLGVLMRACAENPHLAARFGVRAHWISAMAWSLAAAFAALAGIAVAWRTTLSPAIEGEFLTAFPAVLLGGFDSVVGAVLGSFILAGVTQLSAFRFGSDVALPIGYGVLLLTLILRPTGLFGSRDEIRV